MKYDVIVVGSGLGGLQCGYILSKEGYKVCVLEKNARIGGCLQTFTRNGVGFDTGIHYVGGLDDGQLLNRYFKYFGLMDKLRLQRLDEDGFDHIMYGGEEYKLAIGYDRFVDGLAAQFPKEARNLHTYLSTLKEQADLIGMSHLQDGRFAKQGTAKFERSAYQFIQQVTQNETLRNVLSGNNLLFDGIKDLTPLFVYAIITEPYITSAYRFIDGSQQLADLLADTIRANGGEVLTKSEVTHIAVDTKGVSGVRLSNGELVETDYLVSNIHPQRTLELLDENTFLKKAYYTRIASLQNGCGNFTVYVALKPNTVGYRNYNCYYYEDKDVWDLSIYNPKRTTRNVLTSFIASGSEGSPNQPGVYAKGLSILTPMFWEEVEQWKNTKVGDRGDDYEAMKQRRAERLIDFVSGYLPELKGGIEAYYTSTPLTYRDYTGTVKGSSYGVIKSFVQPDATLIAPKTRIPNLLFTGQNMNLHGVLGVTLTSAMTCAELLGEKYLATKITAG